MRLVPLFEDGWGTFAVGGGPISQYFLAFRSGFVRDKPMAAEAVEAHSWPPDDQRALVHSNLYSA